MGLYDEFRTDGQEVACPGCGKKIDTLQSKSLPDPSLMEYKLGDELDVMTSDGLARLVIPTGRLLCHTSCAA